MKTVLLQRWIIVLIISLFSQNVLAATRMLPCNTAEHSPPLSQEHSQAHCQQAAGHQQTEHAATTQPIHPLLSTADHCQPGCHCCSAACSPSLLGHVSSTGFVPATEVYAFQHAHPPVSPVESTLKPPCFS